MLYVRGIVVDVWTEVVRNVLRSGMAKVMWCYSPWKYAEVVCRDQ